MLSSRNDWNYNAGMDESLNTHRGGGYLCGINNTPYSFTMLHIKIFGGYVFSSLAKRFGGVRISCARYRAFQAAYVCAAFFACF